MQYSVDKCCLLSHEIWIHTHTFAQYADTNCAHFRNTKSAKRLSIFRHTWRIMEVLFQLPIDAPIVWLWTATFLKEKNYFSFPKIIWVILWCENSFLYRSIDLSLTEQQFYWTLLFPIDWQKWFFIRNTCDSRNHTLLYLERALDQHTFYFQKNTKQMKHIVNV